MSDLAFNLNGEENMVLYQGALASHAKRDAQWRTVGSLVAKLVG